MKHASLVQPEPLLQAAVAEPLGPGPLLGGPLLRGWLGLTVIRAPCMLCIRLLAELALSLGHLRSCQELAQGRRQGNGAIRNLCRWAGVRGCERHAGGRCCTACCTANTRRQSPQRCRLLRFPQELINHSIHLHPGHSRSTVRSTVQMGSNKRAVGC